MPPSGEVPKEQRPGAGGDLLDTRSYQGSVEEQESRPLERIFRRAIDDLKRHNV